MKRFGALETKPKTQVSDTEVWARTSNACVDGFTGIADKG